MRSWTCQKEAYLLCLGRIVDKPYLVVTSCLPVLRPEQQMARRSWRPLPRRLAGLGKNSWKAPAHDEAAGAADASRVQVSYAGGVLND